MEVNFNSNEYVWADIIVVLLGREVTGLRGVEYKVKSQMEALFASGRKPGAYKEGKRSTREQLPCYKANLSPWTGRHRRKVTKISRISVLTSLFHMCPPAVWSLPTRLSVFPLRRSPRYERGRFEDGSGLALYRPGRGIQRFIT